MPVPVGEVCVHCSELVDAGDRGVLCPTAEMVDGRVVAATRPVHVECWVRMGVGGPAHLMGVCACHARPGGPWSEDPDLGMGPREAALLVWDWVQANGGGRS